MYVKGLKIPEGYDYVKFIKSSNTKVTLQQSLKALVIEGLNTAEFIEFENIDSQEIDTTLDYLKIPKSTKLILPNVIISKNIYEDLTISIFVIKLEGDDIVQTAQSTCIYTYDSICVLLREDEANTEVLKTMLDNLKIVSCDIITSGNVGNLSLIPIRNKDINWDYQSDIPQDWNDTIAVLDWSQPTEKYLQLLSDQLKHYQFGDPLTEFPQEIPKNNNLIIYDLETVSSDLRGHLIGKKWDRFHQSKLKINLTFVLTTTQSYLTLLYEMHNQNKVVNICGYDVVDNNGRTWKVAVTYEFPVITDLDDEEPKGTLPIVGNVIKCNLGLHYYTISRSQQIIPIEEIIVELSDKNANKIIYSDLIC